MKTGKSSINFNAKVEMTTIRNAHRNKNSGIQLEAPSIFHKRLPKLAHLSDQFVLRFLDLTNSPAPNENKANGVRLAKI